MMNVSFRREKLVLSENSRRSSRTSSLTAHVPRVSLQGWNYLNTATPSSLTYILNCIIASG